MKNKETRDYLVDVLRIRDKKSLEEIMPLVSCAHIRKGRTILRKGERIRECLFLIDGVARGVTYDGEGHTCTDYFVYKKGDFVNGMITSDGTSITNIEAITDLDVYRILFNDAMRIVKTNILIAEFANHWIKNALIKSMEMKRILLQKDAYGKYLWFKETYGDLEGRIEGVYIASILNMTHATYSRQKSKYKNNLNKKE